MFDASNVERMDGGLRVLLGTEQPCSFGCTYCHARTPEIASKYRELKEAIQSIDTRVRNAIRVLGDSISCVFGTRIHDIFGSNPQQAIPTIEKLASYGTNVSLLTKAALPADTIDALQDIDTTLRRTHGKRIVTEFSIVSGRERPDLEPRAPSVRARIETIQELARRGMCAAICISPQLPSSVVPDVEVDALIDRTVAFTRAYTVVKAFYWLPLIARRMGIQDDDELVRHSIATNFLPCGTGGELPSTWNVFKSPRTPAVMDRIRQRDRAAFSKSADTVKYLAERSA